MIGVDTNVLVRYLVDDEPQHQCERAADLFERAVSQGADLFLSNIVLCECVWVLESAYRVSRAEIADVLNRLLEARHVRFRDRALVRSALQSYRHGEGDFADYLIRDIALDEGCEEVATFDRALLDDSEFIAP